MSNGRIRALYGHSIEAKIRKETAVPPLTLSIMVQLPKRPKSSLRDGLKPMNRQYVHLSTDMDMAAQVGRRKNRTPMSFYTS